MKKFLFFLIIFLLNATVICRAQTQRQYIFTSFKKNTGLLSNKVFQVVQDKKGYVWIGTDNGLQRYDGYRFTNFRHITGDSLGIPDDLISLLYVDQKGRLWITSGRKLGIFDPSTARFTNVPIRVAETEITKGIRKFITNKDGHVMVFVAKTLVTYHEEKKEMSAEHNFIRPPEGFTCEDMFQDPASGQYWVTGKSGLIMFDPKTRHYSYRGHNVSGNPVIARFGDTLNTLRPYVDLKGRVWFAQGIPLRSAPVMHCYNPKTNTGSTYRGLGKGYYEVWGISEQAEGSVFLFGYNLLLEFNEAKDIFVPVRDPSLNEFTIQFDYVTKLYRDRDENLWACTNLGLYLFNPRQQAFTSLAHSRPGDTLKNNTATTAIIVNAKNEIWMATWGKGIFSYDLNFNPIENPVVKQKPEYSSLPVWSMCQLKNGEVWIGSQLGHLIVNDPVRQIVADYRPSVFSGGTIRQMLADKSGNVWLGTDNGFVIRCEKGNWSDTTNSFVKVQTLPGRVVRFFERKNGEIWVATDIYGLYRLDPANGKVLTHYDEKKGKGKELYNATVTDLIEYNDTTILIASNAINILNTRTGNIESITTADGLPSNQAVNLTKDKSGYLWVSLSNGLSRFSYDRKVFTSYDVRDGILNDNFEISSPAHLADGRLIMGTLHDFLVFNPNEVNRQNDQPAGISITDVKVMGKSVSLDSIMQLKKVELGHNDNSISFDYSAMRFLQQNKVVYYHQMTGIDKDWVRSENQQAMYTYLPAGEYSFRVKSVNGNGVTSEKIAEMEIHVDRPFWKSWWFYAALFLIAMAMVYWIDKERVKRMIHMHRMRSQIAGDLHEEIHTTLNNIHLLSELAKMKAEKDTVRSKEYINQISDKSKRMIVAMDDILWSIQPENDSMEKMLLRMQEYTEALKNHHGIQINMQVEERVRTMKMEMNVRHQFLLIFKEGLRTVIETLHGTQTLINIDILRNRLFLKVQDLSVSDSANAEAAESFESMRKRADSIDADLDIQSDSNKVSFIVSLPVISPSIS
ncbi:MAG: hypothetical protein H7Y27_01825 [Gemmatimonadaceae bacterium]|nr:hypothetical protein [Chitinophagaceae bacterium]